MTAIRSSLIVEADAQSIWEQLKRPNSYPYWNPMIHKISGSLKEGGIIKVSMRLPSWPKFVFGAKVVQYQAPHLIIWEGNFMEPWIYGVQQTIKVLELDRHIFLVVLGMTFSKLETGYTDLLKNEIQFMQDRALKLLRSQVEQLWLEPHSSLGIQDYYMKYRSN